MVNNIQKFNIQFITCPDCNGSGKNKNYQTCTNCGGLALVAYFQNRFFYWGVNLTRAIIKLDYLKRAVHLFLNLVAYTIGIIGLATLAWWIWQSSGALADLEAFSFWRVKSWLILIFWISLIADMFVIYRLSEEEALKHKLEKPKYSKDLYSEISLPNNWNELKKVKAKYKIEISKGFSYEAMKIVEDAFTLADQAKHSQTDIIHLFFSLLKNNEAAAVFYRLNVDSAKLIEKIKNQLLSIQPEEKNTEMSHSLKEVLLESYIEAMRVGQKKVLPMNFILPSLARDKNISEILYELEIDADKIKNVIQWFVINQRLIDNYKLYKKMARYKPASAMNRAYTAVATPVLNHFVYDLTIAAKWARLEFCVGREQEVKAIWQAIESGQRGIILVGPVGVGKNTIIGQIAQLMTEEDVPQILKDKRLVELDTSRILSGATPSQAQQRLLVIIDEINRAGNIILYINNIENLMGITSGGEESLDLSEILASAIERKELTCFASAIEENFIKFIENKPLGNALFKIIIEEPNYNQAIQMIESKIGYFEANYKVYFSYNSIAKAVELTNRYLHDKYLPAKAIDILESVAAKVSKEKGINSIISEEDIAEIISQITKIPVTKISENESENLLNLEKRMHQRMVDQIEAVDMVAASLRRARTELRESKRPIANFLFLGPTGVGKTELAKTVAEVYFGNENYMIRLDMSEYQHKESIEKMIGAPDGTLGYLTEAVRKKPFSLILLDEFEKADPNILNLFLQVMDDGRLTDGQGRTIDFTNSIIIATSNIGAVYIQEQIMAKTQLDQIKDKLINEQINKVIRPELINRFDGIIVFKPLNEDDVANITKIMLNKIKNMLEVKGIGLKFEDLGVKKLANLGFDPKFGARPLRRLLQDKIENEIANKILSGEIKRRDTIIIDAEANVLIEKGRKL